MGLQDQAVVDRDATHTYSGRMAFILSAIGFAIGLGNLWRFPIYVYRYGGGAFFIPYIFGLIFLGMPLLLLETGIGNAAQAGPVAAFGFINPRFRGIGAAAAYCAFVTCTYYSSILAWGLVYLVESFYDELPWAVNVDPSQTYNASILDGPNDHFYDDVLKSSDPSETEIIVSSLFAGNLIIWVVSYLAVFQGAKITGYVAYVTVTAPIVLLLVILIRAASLEGAKDGINVYIGTWEFSKLQDGEMWVNAISQIFFSLGVGFASLIGFGSYTHRGFNVVSNSIIVGVGNSVFSFFAGFAVFEILGWFSNLTGVPIQDVTPAGPSLTFIVYPTALAELPAPQFFNVLFFLTIFFLGVDSLFGLMEGTVAGINDTKYLSFLNHVPKFKIGVIFAFGWLFSIWYVSDAGLWLLDVVDHYVANYALLFVGCAEAFSLSWVHLHDDMVDRVGFKSMMLFEIAYLGGIFIGTIVCMFVTETLGGAAAVGVGFGVGIGVFVLLTALSVSAAISHSGLSVMEVLDLLCNYQIDDVRTWINKTVTQGYTNGNMQIPRFWNLMIKFVVPGTIITLILINARYRVIDGPFGGYPDFYTFVAALVILGAIGLFMLGVFFPECYAPADDAVGGDSEDFGVSDKKKPSEVESVEEIYESNKASTTTTDELFTDANRQVDNNIYVA
eukprot:Clim_evm22s215 gene=Clim_evmTU22s215